MKALGIGCFLFTLKGGHKAAKDFDPATFLQGIKAALEAIDNISDVEVSHLGEDFYLNSSSFHDEEIEGDENFFPIFSDVILKFKVFMPNRLVEKFGLGRKFSDGVEHFNVTIIFDGDMPVTYVTYDINSTEDDLHDYSPSTAIIFIREYLEDKLAAHPLVDFRGFGPSPFHADFFLITDNSSPNVRIADLSISARGYRTYLGYIPNKDQTIDVEYFFYSYHWILSAYYQLMRYRNIRLHLNIAIINGARALIGEPKHRLPKNGDSINRVYRSLLEEQLNSLDRNEYLAKLADNELWSNEDVLQNYIVKDTNDVQSSPSEEVKQILAMMEERRQSYIRNSVTIIAGLTGGILGATLTFLLAKTNHTVEHSILPAPQIQQIDKAPIANTPKNKPTAE